MTPPADVDGMLLHPVNVRAEQPRPAEYTPITPPDGLADMAFWNTPSSYEDYNQYGLNDVSSVYPGGQLFEDSSSNFQEHHI
jgi:hypothetical protein